MGGGTGEGGLGVRCRVLEVAFVIDYPNNHIDLKNRRFVYGCKPADELAEMRGFLR